MKNTRKTFHEMYRSYMGIICILKIYALMPVQEYKIATQNDNEMNVELCNDAENDTGVSVWTDCRHQDPPLSEWLQASSGPAQPPASGWWPPAPSQPWPPDQRSAFDPGSDDVNDEFQE
jgi:hypothetical protein